MHEFSVVEQLITNLLAQLERMNVPQVKEIHLRRGSTFAEAPLRQAFRVLSPDTPLADARLVIEELSVTHTCARCSRTQTLTSDDLIGHLFICPTCGAPKEIDEAHGIELLKVIA